MSSIFKGDSIYKSGGGGGGGYKDGGQIVDSDLMKVENNAVSSYDNVNRDQINFYFDPADGEILNSIIELTTAVNATVNIYVLRNGFYYLLGNVGGNTVTSGNDYKVNVTGDSFSIEEVTAQSEIFIDVFGIITPVVKIGNKYWTSENLYSVFDDLTIGGPYQMTSPAAWWYQNNPSAYGHNGTKYNLYYNVAAAKYIDNNIGGGWRVATKYDFQQLISYVGDLSKIFADGTNETGLSLVLNGNYAYDNYWNQVSTATVIRYRDDPPYSYGPFISGDKINVYYNTLTEESGRGVPIRLVHDA